MRSIFGKDSAIPNRSVPRNLPVRIKLKPRELVIPGLTALLAAAVG
jgi:hypothetical protein